jgi:hypothetical protein
MQKAHRFSSGLASKRNVKYLAAGLSVDLSSIQRDGLLRSTHPEDKCKKPTGFLVGLSQKQNV